MSEHFISRADAESDILACAAYIAESIGSSDGHAEAMLAVVPRFLEKGDVDLAAELANTVDDPFTRDKLIIRVAEVCAAAEDDEYAEQLIDSLEDQGLRSEGLERLGTVKAAGRRFEKAGTIAESMSHPEHVLAAIAAEQHAAGQTSEAEDTIRRIGFPGSRITAFLGIANQTIEGDKDTALAFLDRALDDAVEIDHDEERLRALVEIGGLFADAGKNGKAIEAFDKVREYAEALDSYHRDAFFSAASIGLLRAGSQDLSDRALDLAVNKTHIASTLLGHSRIYWEREAKDDAIEAVEEAYVILRSQRENETPNSRERFRLFGLIAEQFANYGKGERAIGIADEIADDDERIAALSQLAAVFARNNEDELSKQALNAIKEDSDRAFALIRISDAKAASGDLSAAIADLNESVHLIETVPQFSLRASAYNEIARRFAKYDHADGFDQAIEKCVEAISTVRDESTRVTSLVALSELTDSLGLDIPPEDLDFLKKMLRDIPVD